MARQTYNHLVIVCCHGIWLGGPKRGFDESEWLIESFRASETPTFIQHIKAGLRVLKDDDSSVLMFSGYGHTVFINSGLLPRAKLSRAFLSLPSTPVAVKS